MGGTLVSGTNCVSEQIVLGRVSVGATNYAGGDGEKKCTAQRGTLSMEEQEALLVLEANRRQLRFPGDPDLPTQVFDGEDAVHVESKREIRLPGEITQGQLQLLRALDVQLGVQVHLGVTHAVAGQEKADPLVGRLVVDVQFVSQTAGHAPHVFYVQIKSDAIIRQEGRGVRKALRQQEVLGVNIPPNTRRQDPGPGDVLRQVRQVRVFLGRHDQRIRQVR